MDLMEIKEKERLSREDAAAACTPSRTRLGTTRSSLYAAICASRCMCPTRSTSSSRSRSATTSGSSRSS